MDYPILQLPHILKWLLISLRVFGMFVASPLFGTRSIPPQMKVAFSFILGFVFDQLFVAPIPGLSNLHWLNIMMLASSELVIGLFIGYIALLIFGVIQFSGSLLDTMTGMHVASVLDPMTREQQSLLGQLQYILASLLFLQFNGHHAIISAVYSSFKQLPVGSLIYLHFGPATFMSLITLTFAIGLQITAPIVAILFLIDFSLGIIAKGVPQLNVFMNGMPLKAMIAFISLYILLLYFSSFYAGIPTFMYKEIVTIIQSISPPH